MGRNADLFRQKNVIFHNTSLSDQPQVGILHLQKK